MPTPSPLYRHERIFAREGVALSRQVLAGWMGHVGFHLEPLADRILQIIRAGPRVFADETTLPTLAPGLGRTKTGWLWTYVRDDRPFGGADPPMVAYRFEDSREAKCPLRHLAGFSGLLQVDGYTAYKRLADPARPGGPVLLAACWAHLRRKLYELHISGVSETATWSVERMAALWAIEAQVRGRGPDERQQVRLQSSASLVAELFTGLVQGMLLVCQLDQYVGAAALGANEALDQQHLLIERPIDDAALPRQRSGVPWFGQMLIPQRA